MNYLLVVLKQLPVLELVRDIYDETFCKNG